MVSRSAFTYCAAVILGSPSFQALAFAPMHWQPCHDGITGTMLTAARIDPDSDVQDFQMDTADADFGVCSATKAAWHSVWSNDDWERAAPSLEKARDVLASGGVIIAPSHVGYSLYALDGPAGAQKIDRIKGRNKPIGLSGNTEAFRRVFGFSPPDLRNDYCSDLFLSLVGEASKTSLDERDLARLQSSRAIGPKGEVAMWLGGGPVTDYLADQMIGEGRFILVSSANVSGEGNPASETYTIDAIDSAVCDAADYIVDVPHWATPQHDEEGRWLSAPMFDLETMSFRRVGRHTTKANAVMSAFYASKKTNNALKKSMPNS